LLRPANGTKLVAVASALQENGAIYVSSNSGATWTQTTAPALDWVSVASSADGTKLIAAVGDSSQHTAAGLIYISNDSGATWSVSGLPNLSWSSVASTPDGCKRLAAGWTDASNGGLIYVSQTTYTDVGHQIFQATISSFPG